MKPASPGLNEASSGALMEADLFVLCRCVDDAQRQSFARILDKVTRPLLKNDVEEFELPGFNALEDTEFPEYLENIGSNYLFIHWWLGARFELDEVHPDVAALRSAGAVAIEALLYVDGAPQVLVSMTGAKTKMHIYGESPVEGILKPRSDDTSGLIDYLMQQERNGAC